MFSKPRHFITEMIPITLFFIVVFLIPMQSTHAVNYQIIENDLDNTVVIDLEIPDDDMKIITSENSQYSRVTVKGCSDIRPFGELRTPIFSKLVRVSNELKPEVSLDVIHSRSLDIDGQPLISDGKDFTGFDAVDTKFQRQHQHKISNRNPAVEIGEPAVMRDLRVVRLIFRPIRFISTNNTVEFLQKVRITLRMTDIDTRNVLSDPRPISRSYDPYYAATVMNYFKGNYNRDGEAENYLIFTPDSYEGCLQSFIAWKELEGFNVQLMRRSELPQWPSPADLRNLLQAAYDGPDRPAYVMLIGQEDSTPIYYTYDPTHPGDYADDLYFSLLEGSDIYPDVFMSRLPVENVYEVSVMINKIMRYELNPYMENPEFYRTALMAASTMEESQVTTKQQTAERLTTYLGYETILSVYEWDETSIDNLMDLIDGGVSIINYRGEGWRRGWNPNHEYWFDNEDVDDLECWNLTPFITSIGCGVSLFDTTDDCWSHAFMALGTPTTPNGAVGIIGPTYNTHTTHNNWQDRGMYRGYVYHGIHRAVPFMNYGKDYMYDQFPEPENFEEINVHYRTYLHFGTPDMWIRMGEPTHPMVGLAYGYDNMDRYITVRDGHGNIADAAQVAFAANGERKVYATDEHGGVPTGFTTVDNNSIHVVVAGKNLIPFEGFLQWSHPNTDGDLVITELKPDIPTDGLRGDKIEIFNRGDTPVDLQGWIVTDLDQFDIPFVHNEAVLQPKQIAVIEFFGPLVNEEIIWKPYGLYIKSREIPDFSSLEDVAALRNPDGVIVDSLAWNDQSGIGSTNVAEDLDKVTAPSSVLDVSDEGWWDGPNDITQENYEDYTINWAPFAGNGGPGSIQRSTFGDPDGIGNFTVQHDSGFGDYWYPLVKVKTESIQTVDEELISN